MSPEVDMSSSNSWAEFAGVFRGTRSVSLEPSNDLGKENRAPRFPRRCCCGHYLAELAQGKIGFVFVKMIPGCAADATAAQQAIDERGLTVNGSGVKVGVLSDSFNNLGGAADAEVTDLNCQKRPR
jgi:hypothetical protein